MEKKTIGATINKIDKPLAIGFTILSVLFILLAFTNTEFFAWAFARHQNPLSWYIRPLFLIPFCIFSYKKSLAGIAATIFLMLTSMFWFPEPTAIDQSIKDFLKMEQDYLLGNWTWAKVLTTVLVPVSLTALSIAFWKRSLWMGIAVLVFIAVAKMLWSVMFGGESGQAVILPAIIGLLVCIVLLTVGFLRLNKKNNAKRDNKQN